jgi:pyruvate kinase
MEYSRAQIVATLGPSSREEGIIEQMMIHQMDVVRLNFSWGTHDDHARYIKIVRELAQKYGKKVPIIQDLSGPRIQGEKGHYIDVSMTELITPKDLDDLKFGLANDVDYIAMSYVGSAEDVMELKRHIRESGKRTPVISKIERQKAIDNIDEIIDASDAIMIARGDMGNEVLLEKIPLVEKTIIEKCKKAGKPVITATQMFLSMVENLEPSRAEVTDVFFAITNGSDAVMLSDETANGKHPVEAVMNMEKVTLEAEKLYNLKVNPL